MSQSSIPSQALSTAPLASESNVRRQMAAAAGRIKRLKRIDRLAVGVITLGGLAVVACVVGILLFIGVEAVPLLLPAKASRAGSLRPADVSFEPGIGALGADESLRHVYAIDSAGRIAFFSPETGARTKDIALSSVAGVAVTASSRSLSHDFVALGTNDGRVALAQIRFTPVHEDGVAVDIKVDVDERGIVAIDPERRSVRRVAYLEEAERKIVVAQVSDTDVALSWIDGGETRQQIVQADEGKVTAVAIGNRIVLAGTDGGAVQAWELGETAARIGGAKAGSAPITALGYMIGGRTFVAGLANGEVSVWFQAPVGADDAMRFVRPGEFESQGAAVTGFSASARDRTFATAGADGQVFLRHQTSGRTLLRIPGTDAVRQIAFAPRSDALLIARSTGEVERFALANPHPEMSWHALFGKVWYEGYPQPEYVWQSTGATDDFEPKLSLTPLIFGTIKGTFYALIFAIPLAVIGALYTSQFVHPSIRARIKPVVEIMAALPSVVIGFIGGLYLAPVAERHLVAVMLMMVALPLFGTSGFLFWSVLPPGIRNRMRAGSELLVILPMLVLCVWVCLMIAPTMETLLFAGDARQWLSTALGVTYDQRNSLVVGLAMGFAVIPIIFTISEDAFSSVPSTLSAASLALGASRWQTAVRVVIPTASPGVFSAIMVGFGRAVGETMIVLMATGNTPVLDWSLFNGFRTLSANIAVEIPEAPHGGSLYRLLFASSAVLFIMTFTLNTIAEVIRQRLRQRYKAV